MKSLFISFSLLFLSAFLIAQDSPEWVHFYGNQAPDKISASDKRMGMTGGKGLMRYNIDTDEIEHFNSESKPELPTNYWVNVLENPSFNTIWAVPGRQVADLFPIYRHDPNDENWVGFDLDEMFDGEFDYQKLGTSPGGRVLIPGVRTLEDGSRKLLVAIHQSDQSWVLKEVMDNPTNYKTPIGVAHNGYFIDAGFSKGIYGESGISNTVIDFTEELAENYTSQHKIVRARSGQSDTGIYFINDHIRIFSMDLSFGIPSFEYETEDIGLPEQYVLDPEYILSDKAGYFWAIDNEDNSEDLWRFKRNEMTTVFPLSGFENIQGSRWELMQTDKYSQMWLRKSSLSNLWKFSTEFGMTKIALANSDMPNVRLRPVGVIGDSGLIFTSNEKLYKFEKGIFTEADLDLEESGYGTIWTLPLSENVTLYGKSGTDRYFSQEKNSKERKIFFPKTEDGTALRLHGIPSVSPSGNLYGFVYDPSYPSMYWVKRKGNDFWEDLDIEILDENGFPLTIAGFVFADDNRLFVYKGDFAYWYDINTGQLTSIDTAEDLFGIKIKRSASGQIFLNNSRVIGRLIDNYPVFTEIEDITMREGELLNSVTVNEKDELWMSTNLGRVFLWNGEEILKEFHPADSGLSFIPSSIHFDSNKNLWLCHQTRGCAVYRENGVDLDFKGEIQGENDFGERPFILSPNPVQNQLTIRSTVELNSIKIYDATGREVINLPLNAVDNYQINTENLQKGIYFGTINEGLNQLPFKFVKQ